MQCLVQIQRHTLLQPNIPPDTRSARRIGIALFNGFALPDAATIIEVFQSVNAFTTSSQRRQAPYEVCLLSATGGRIASSSSVHVWTDSVDMHSDADGFRALFIAGGTGAAEASRDERLVTWLRRAYPCADLIFPLAEGRLLLEAAGLGLAASGRSHSERLAKSLRNLSHGTHFSAPADPSQLALAVVHEDLGTQTARQISNRIAPPAETQFTSIVRKNASAGVSEKIQESARWLEANGDRPVAIDEAAQIAAMSERNFLRRFKLEMGVTPSDYLLFVRLDMSCRLLGETNLPVDKIARRCGIGSGGRLSKLFRKHLGTTPTEYRANKRAAEKSA
jgi:transcriptional regulator GlxA family with amidase domain